MRMPDEEVLEHEPTPSALQRAAAAKARKLAINCDGVRLNAHKLIPRATVWTIELRVLG